MPALHPIRPRLDDPPDVDLEDLDGKLNFNMMAGILFTNESMRNVVAPHGSTNVLIVRDKHIELPDGVNTYRRGPAVEGSSTPYWAANENVRAPDILPFSLPNIDQLELSPGLHVPDDVLIARIQAAVQSEKAKVNGTPQRETTRMIRRIGAEQRRRFFTFPRNRKGENMDNLTIRTWSKEEESNLWWELLSSQVFVTEKDLAQRSRARPSQASSIVAQFS